MAFVSCKGTSLGVSWIWVVGRFVQCLADRHVPNYVLNWTDLRFVLDSEKYVLRDVEVRNMRKVLWKC